MIGDNNLLFSYMTNPNKHPYSPPVVEDVISLCADYTKNSETEKRLESELKDVEKKIADISRMLKTPHLAPPVEMQHVKNLSVQEAESAKLKKLIEDLKSKNASVCDEMTRRSEIQDKNKEAVEKDLKELENILTKNAPMLNPEAIKKVNQDILLCKKYLKSLEKANIEGHCLNMELTDKQAYEELMTSVRFKSGKALDVDPVKRNTSYREAQAVKIHMIFEDNVKAGSYSFRAVTDGKLADGIGRIWILASESEFGETQVSEYSKEMTLMLNVKQLWDSKQNFIVDVHTSGFSGLIHRFMFDL